MYGQLNIAAPQRSTSRILENRFFIALSDTDICFLLAAFVLAVRSAWKEWGRERIYMASPVAVVLYALFLGHNFRNDDDDGPKYTANMRV